MPESAIEEDRVADFGPYWNRCSGVVVGGAMQFVVEVAAWNDIEIATAFLRYIAEPKADFEGEHRAGGKLEFDIDPTAVLVKAEWFFISSPQALLAVLCLGVNGRDRYSSY